MAVDGRHLIRPVTKCLGGGGHRHDLSHPFRMVGDVMLNLPPLDAQGFVLGQSDLIVAPHSQLVSSSAATSRSEGCPELLMLSALSRPVVAAAPTVGPARQRGPTSEEAITEHGVTGEQPFAHGRLQPQQDLPRRIGETPMLLQPPHGFRVGQLIDRDLGRHGVQFCADRRIGAAGPARQIAVPGCGWPGW